MRPLRALGASLLSFAAAACGEAAPLPPAPPPEPPPAAPAPGETPLRRLSRLEYTNTVRDLLGLEAATDGIPDPTSATFSNSAADFSVGASLLNQYLLLAESLAARADLQRLSPCDVKTRGEAACAEAFLRAAGRRALRRPLDEEERAAALARFQALRAAGDYDTALRAALQGLLLSPAFLYHVELGAAPGPAPAAGPARVTPLELASRLSYLLWQSMPDEGLLADGESGALGAPDVLAAQVDRLLRSPRARAAVTRFHEEWLRLGLLLDAHKDPARYPTFAATQGDVVEGSRRFLEDVVFAGPGDLRALLTAPYTFANGAVAKIYGWAPSGDSFQRVDLDPQRAAGLLTQPALLAALGKADKSAPILRGVFVLSQLLCQPPPPPPPGASTIPPGAPPARTTREFFAALTQAPSCQGCHGRINGVGFGLEAYDAIGAYRDKEGEAPIDASGAIDVGDGASAFAGAAELGRRLAGSAQVRDCVVRQWFRYGTGRIEVEGDQPILAELGRRFAASGERILALPAALAQSEAFSRLHYTINLPGELPGAAASAGGAR